MALNMPVLTARLILTASLSAILSACSSGPAPSAMALDPNSSQVVQRGAEPEATDYYSERSVVPRAYVAEGDIQSDAPDLYTVVRGDTLWDISDRFLKKPWLWTTIWDYNPQVHNPHLIYPGDELALEYINGQPTLTLKRKGKVIPRLSQSGQPLLGAANPVVLDAQGNPTSDQAGRTRLSPRIRTESLDNAVPTIQGDSIQQFLVHPMVLDADAIAAAPYIVANENKSLVSASGNRIYVRGQMNRNQTSYGIYRPSKKLLDPVNGAFLGHEVSHIGNAKLLNIGDPSTFTITDSNMEAGAGDILLPSMTSTGNHNYTTRLPVLQGDARIISMVNAITQTGKDQVVVMNIGSNSNIREGDVLAIETRGDHIVDKKGQSNHRYVKLPNIRTGVLMVFKTFDKVSYGLVMESTRPVSINDIVTGI